jgi:hypothetical protein
MKKIITLFSLTIVASFAQADYTSFRLGNVTAYPAVFTCNGTGAQINVVPGSFPNYLSGNCPGSLSLDTNITVQNTSNKPYYLVCGQNDIWHGEIDAINVAPGQSASCPTDNAFEFAIISYLKPPL